MVVRHNLTASNANRYLGINNKKLSKSLEKLSTGYAINRSADNAAGLAVSEKMRSQIAGMTQAVKNAQDGISMIQTFEGALTETDSILQRMKTLADQSANGTYQSMVDRDVLELEFQQLNDELNHIADTDYNGVVVLNGGTMSDGSTVNNVNVVSKRPVITYKPNGKGDNSIIYSDTISGTVSSSGSGSITINGVRVNIFGGNSTVTNDSTGETGEYRPFGTNGDIGNSYEVQDIAYDPSNGGWTGTINVTEYFILEPGSSLTVNGVTFRLSSDGDIMMETSGLEDDDASGQEVIFGSMPKGDDGEIYYIGLRASYQIDETGAVYNELNGKIVGFINLAQGVSVYNSYQHSARNLTYADSLTVQAGARAKDSVEFNFAYSTNGIGTLHSDMDCSARGLGTDQLTLATQEQANFAIDQIDNAINKVSMVRATFGAAQNRLEHKIDNLNVSVENLTSAESLIRDTNMPTEMMNFTKMQILAQTSQSMLTQASQLPQSVLSLLQ